MARGPSVLILMLVLAGCLSGQPAREGEGNEPQAESVPRFVLLVDSGVNPYHETFRADPALEASLISSAPFGYTTLRLSENGTYEDRLKADASIFEGLQKGKLYHVQGTRILAISFVNGSNVLSNQQHVLLDDSGHGAQTSSLVARADPEAVIVMAEVEGQLCDDGTCTLDPSVAEALTWGASQAWIDVISVSVGVPGSPPDSAAVHPHMETFLDATRTAAETGKLVVVGAGNSPGPAITGYTAGPPWIIAVGGYEPANNGEVATASKGVDVVANFSAEVADPRSTNGTAWGVGTSFSTPIVAGTLSRALGSVRTSAADAIPATAFRSALNASAVVVQATDYDPSSPPQNDTILGRVYSPAIPILAPSQQGWGWVHEGLAEEIAARVLANDLSPPASKSTIAAWQAQWQAARESYWG